MNKPDARPQTPPQPRNTPTAAQHNTQAGATVNRYHFIPKHNARRKK